MSFSKNLEIFVGKVCTILTKPVNIQFRDFMQHAQYFTGEVSHIDEYGIWLEHNQTKQISFFSLENIVGIVEEQKIPLDHPMADQIKEAVAKKQQPKQPFKNPNQLPKQTFIPVEELSKIVKKTN